MPEVCAGPIPAARSGRSSEAVLGIGLGRSIAGPAAAGQSRPGDSQNRWAVRGAVRTAASNRTQPWKAVWGPCPRWGAASKGVPRVLPPGGRSQRGGLSAGASLRGLPAPSGGIVTERVQVSRVPGTGRGAVSEQSPPPRGPCRGGAGGRRVTGTGSQVLRLTREMPRGAARSGAHLRRSAAAPRSRPPPP